MGCTVRSFVQKAPKVPFAAIAKDILGKSYELSVVLAGKDRAGKANMQTRGKSYVPNVLSIPLSKASGEIMLCPEVSKKEAASFNHTERTHLAFLFIHGCLHLKGLAHGKEMDKKELYYLKKHLG